MPAGTENDSAEWQYGPRLFAFAAFAFAFASSKIFW